MPQWAQAKRKVNAHILGGNPDEYVERGDVVDVSDYSVPERHFYDRGEHDEQPPPLSEPGSVEDTTVLSDENVTYVDAYEGEHAATQGPEEIEGDVTGQPEIHGEEGPHDADLSPDETGDETEPIPDQSINPLDVIDGIGEARMNDIKADLEVATVGEFADVDAEVAEEAGYGEFHAKARNLVDKVYED